MTAEANLIEKESTEQPLLKVENLSIRFIQGTETTEAVNSVSFSLNKGETLAIVGESGSGKSVTAHALTRLLPKQSALYSSGKVLLNGLDLLKIPEIRLQQIRGNKIAMIFQEPMTALNPLHTIERQITEPLLQHAQRYLSRQNQRQRVLELLDLVGLPNAKEKLRAYPHELSGGQRQRVMIAMALANEPDILIADEPTTALDVTLQKQILALLKQLQERLGMAMLLISHDLGIVRRYADRVAVMTAGYIVEQNETQQLFNNPQHDYSIKLLNAEPRGAPAALEPDAPILLRTDQLRVWFPIKRGIFKQTVGYIKAVNDISFQLQRGETLGIVGESGSGKTTLVQALLKLTPSKGLIDYRNHHLHLLKRQQMRPLRQQLQIVFQDPFSSLNPRMSIAEIIAEGLVIHQLGNKPSQEQKVIKAMKEVDLDPSIRHRYPHEFSGGQRQRIAIARAIVLEPEIIILDEPTSALDRSVQSQVIDLLRDLQQKHGYSYIFISHDLKVVKALAHNIMVIKGGDLVESGSAEQVFSQPQQAYTKDLIQAAFTDTMSNSNLSDTDNHL